MNERRRMTRGPFRGRGAYIIPAGLVIGLLVIGLFMSGSLLENGGIREQGMSAVHAFFRDIGPGRVQETLSAEVSMAKSPAGKTAAPQPNAPVGTAENQRGVLFHPAIYIGLIAALAGLVIGALCVFILRLRRQLEAARAEIASLATTDGLTGLANRRFFHTRMEEELDRVRRYDANMSLIMLDIDLFREVNDKYGHPLGDVVLKEVSRLIRANLRSSDIVARYGGEEFVVLIPGMDVEAAAKAAEKLRTVIEVNDLTLEGPALKVTVSAGVADCRNVSDEGDGIRAALFREAGNALHRAKTGGRNRVEVHRKSAARQLSFE